MSHKTSAGNAVPSLRPRKRPQVVYRIQNELGGGPFHQCNMREWLNPKRGQAHCMYYKCPKYESSATPLGAFAEAEYYYRIIKLYKFGFESIEHLKSYFWRSEIRAMARKGFHVYRLVLRGHPIVGNSQPIFHHNAITDQKKINIYRTP